MGIPVNLFMRSVIKNNTTVTLKYPITLNTLFSVIFLAITYQHDVVKLFFWFPYRCEALAATHVKAGGKVNRDWLLFRAFQNWFNPRGTCLLVFQYETLPDLAVCWCDDLAVWIGELLPVLTSYLLRYLPCRLPRGARWHLIYRHCLQIYAQLLY